MPNLIDSNTFTLTMHAYILVSPTTIYKLIRIIIFLFTLIYFCLILGPYVIINSIQPCTLSYTTLTTQDYFTLVPKYYKIYF